MSIETNIKEAIKGLNDFEKKQIPFATSKALNDFVFEVLSTIKKEIGDELNITKRAIPSSIRVKKATKNKLYAEIYVDEWSWQYKVLHHHFKGGDRERKGLEKALIYKGYMYKWEILTPPPGVKLNASIYNKIISQLKLVYKAGYSANETKKSRSRKPKEELRFFIITGKSKSPLAPGIYARPLVGTDKPICILRIAEKPEYKKKFDLQKTVKSEYNKKFESILDRALKFAIAMAR